MSTKTSIKRIAAVAAVALTLGGFSAVSAHAAGTTPMADTLAVSSTAVAATSGVASKVVVSTSFLSVGTGTTDSAVKIAAYVLSAPAGNVAVPTFETATVTDYPDSSGGTLVRATEGNVNTSSSVVTAQTADTTYSAASYKLAFTPVKSGTYTVKLVQTIGTTVHSTGVFTATSGATANAPSITITYTVAAKPAMSAASTTAYSSSDYTTLATTLAADEEGTIVVDKGITSTPIAVINVTESNGSTTAALDSSDAIPLTVSTTVGIVSFDQDRSHAGRQITNSSGFSSTGGSTQAALNQKIYVFSDNTTGVATIAISATKASTGETTALATKTVTFSGVAAKYTATATNAVITTAAAAAATTTAISNAGRKAVKVLVSDASGNPVANEVVYAYSDNTTVLTPPTSATSDATGYAYFSLQGSTSGTANLTFSNRASATATTPLVEIKSNAVAIRVGSSTPNTVTLAFDSASYQPGGIGTITATVLDSKGLPVANGVYTVFTDAASTTLAFLQGSTPGTAKSITCVSSSSPYGAVTATDAATCPSGSTAATPQLTAGQVWVKGSTGTATFTVNMPLAAGDVTVSATGASALLGTAGGAVTAKATVGGGAAADAAQAAVDAANEATDAANAATDAANNAMDSADAAQQAALDAGDKADAALAAVTSLATKVSAIATQIAALSALVKKIAAKVKA